MLSFLQKAFSSLRAPEEYDGEIQGHGWKVRIGDPTRDYIKGREVQGKADLGIDPYTSVLVISRSLKQALEKDAFARYIDTEQTMADPNIPEELRWLSTFEEVHNPVLPKPFWYRYAVLAAQKDQALGWLDAELGHKLMDWPEPAPGPKLPFMLMLLRGKAYLRMQWEPRSPVVLKHAAALFEHACERALAMRSPQR